MTDFEHDVLLTVGVFSIQLGAEVAGYIATAQGYQTDRIGDSLIPYSYEVLMNLSHSVKTDELHKTISEFVAVFDLDVLDRTRSIRALREGWNKGRAEYTDEEWEELVKPLREQLREIEEQSTLPAIR